jgi:hypothetical protein
LCYYKDASKLELKGSHTLSSTSGIVGLDSDPHTDAHAHMKPHVKHAFRFKLLAAGSDVVLDADSASDRLKWILAIESIVLELPTHAQSNAHSQAHSQTDPLTHTLGAGSSSSLLRTGSDLTDYVSRYNSKDPKHAPLGFNQVRYSVPYPGRKDRLMHTIFGTSEIEIAANRQLPDIQTSDRRAAIRRSFWPKRKLAHTVTRRNTSTYMSSKYSPTRYGELHTKPTVLDPSASVGN